MFSEIHNTKINQNITLNFTATSNRIVTIHYALWHIHLFMQHWPWKLSGASVLHPGVRSVGGRGGGGPGTRRCPPPPALSRQQSAHQHTPAPAPAPGLLTTWAMSLCHPYGAGIECTCNNRGSPVHCLPIPEHVSQHNHFNKTAQNAIW